MAWFRVRLTEEEQRVVNEERRSSSQPPDPRKDAGALVVAHRAHS